MGRILLGVLIGLLLLPIVVVCWFWFGKVPVAVADPPLRNERAIASIPLQARIHREMIKKAPILVDEDDLIAGAHVYREQCAVCHGLHGKPSTIGAHLFPAAPPLWEKHSNDETIGVSDDAPGETQWKVANGIRLSGMPAYKGVLNDTEIWQVSLLLANADKPLPPAVIALLRGGEPAPPLSTSTVTAAIAATGSDKEKNQKR
jgi:mono/diheme cytochrome c family protein